MDRSIVHVIDTLAPGGAEILLRNSINILSDEFKHVVVYLNEPDILRPSFNSKVEIIRLDHRGWTGLLNTVKKLKRIIKEKKPHLVHSHLLVSNICARMATPQNTPLVNSLHSKYSIDAFKKNRKTLLVERLTLKQRHNLVAVSKDVLEDYLNFVPFRGRSFVLYNFLPDDWFHFNPTPPQSGFKCVAVGGLKKAKNYFYLLEVFSKLKNTDISIDIYGDGSLQQQLGQEIDNYNLPVRLCGNVNDVKSKLSKYQLFIQLSEHEGFGLSVLEAIACRIPVLLSDIKVFHEITNENAYFVSLKDSNRAAEVILNLSKDVNLKNRFVDDAYNYCTTAYSQKNYREKLKAIYNQVMSKPVDVKPTHI